MTEPKSELDKWSVVHEEWVAIQGFMEFVGVRKHGMCVYLEALEEWAPVSMYEIKRLFEESYDIDAIRLEQERRALLEDARE